MTEQSPIDQALVRLSFRNADLKADAEAVDKAMMQAREAGATLRQIAASCGLSAQGVADRLEKISANVRQDS